MKTWKLLPATIAAALAWEAAGRPAKVDLNTAMTVMVDPTVQHFAAPFIAAAAKAGVTIDWMTLIAQLLPLILALIAMFGGGGPTPTPTPVP